MEEDTQILGHTIPKGTTVIFPHYPVHRDPSIWGADSDEFKPERKSHNEAFFPFGVSPRDCLGLKLLSPFFPFSFSFFFSSPPLLVVHSTPWSSISTGRNIAMIEMRVAVSHIFYYYNVRLNDPLAPVEEFSGATMQPRDGVNIILERRIR